MITFFAGFVVAIAFMLLMSKFTLKYAEKKGWYASAVWSEKEKTWKVRGRFLCVAGKILRGIRHEPGADKVKYL